MRSERGSATVLVIGFFLVVALAVAVVVDASAAYLRRQGLANLADAAALAAADGVKATEAYAGHVDEPGPIDVSVARRYAVEYLARTGAEDRYDGLEIAVGVSGGAVTVRLSAPLDLPIAPPDWEDRPVVAAEGAALVVVGQ
jgi:Putative Flp pilus-assembly TadE/G-like